VTEWTAVVAEFLAFMALMAGLLKFYVKAILREFSPNGGNSMRDRVDKIDKRMDTMEDRQVLILDILQGDLHK